MTSVGTQDDDVSNDAGPDVGRKFDGRKLDGRPTKVGRKSEVGRVKLSRRCGDGGRRRYTAAPRNAAAMAGSVAARSVVAALAGNALQLAAFFRRCCSNALDVATLLRWPATRWTSRRCCDGRQRAGPRSVLLRCPAARWASKRCYDVRQRYNSNIFVFFLPDNLKREKEWEKERSFDTCSLVSRLRLSLLWLVVRNVKLPPTTRVATVVTRSFRQQQHE
jgi:hypothetical protein